MLFLGNECEKLMFSNTTSHSSQESRSSKDFI